MFDGWISLSQRLRNGGRLAVTEFACPGVDHGLFVLTAQLPTRLLSSRLSTSWSEGPSPSALVGHGGSSS